MIRFDYTDSDLVTARSFANDTEAHIALARLEQLGIDAFIENDIFSRVLPIGTSSLGALRIVVRRRDLERATALLDSLQFD